ncbi:conserved hypothetical protein [Streptomyces lividans TK24]|nr:conserved hypothetical protein [Streptomyces lividans TK24]
MPDVVLDALAPYVDVLSVQTSPSPGARSAERALDVIGRWHERTGLPVLIADTGNWCPTFMSPGRPPVTSVSAARATRLSPRRSPPGRGAWAGTGAAGWRTLSAVSGLRTRGTSRTGT